MGGFGAKKTQKISYFFGAFFVVHFLFFLRAFLVNISSFMRNSHFTSIKHTFSHVASLVLSGPKCTQHGFLPFVTPFWGSGARVVCILEEEFKGFLYVNFL